MRNSIELHSGESTLYIHPVTHACMIIRPTGSVLKILALAAAVWPWDFWPRLVEIL